MLELVARLADVDSAAATVGRELIFGQSRILPFATTVLEFDVEIEDKRLWCWIGEGACPSIKGAELSHRHEQVRTSVAGEGVSISIDGNRGCITISRTTEGTCPIYLVAMDGVLTASWKYEDVVAALPRKLPNIEACRLYLEYGAARVRDQVIDGTLMLWPGEAVVFSSEGLRFTLNEREVVRPSTFTDAARATDELTALIVRSIRPTVSRVRKAVLELSGGLDSSCVAVAARAAFPSLYSYGLIHEGAVGVQQRNRRKELVELIGVSDFEYNSHDPSPFAALSFEESTYTHNDDNHRLVCAHAIDHHPAGPFDVIISGVGGDELSMENNHICEPWELPGSVCTSSVVASAARADMFMRRGIWPKNPLASQIVVDFCRALPRKFRERRLLNLSMLARAGMSDGFLFPRYSEHFGHGMQKEAAMLDFDELLAESHVADHRIADIAPLLQRARDASNGGFSYDLIVKLWFLLKLERILGRYIP